MALLFGGTETGGDDVSAHVQATVSTTEQQHAGDETVPELNASRGFQVVYVNVCRLSVRIIIAQTYTHASRSQPPTTCTGCGRGTAYTAGNPMVTE